MRDRRLVAGKSPHQLTAEDLARFVIEIQRAARGPRGAVLTQAAAREMLVTGVDREVKTREFVALYKVPPATMECCVTLGFAAVDTRSNADETATWVKERKYKSLRLVTTDWHMRRAAVELARSLPDDITILRDAVPSRPRLGILFLEYNKLLAAAVAQVVTD